MILWIYIYKCFFKGAFNLRLKSRNLLSIDFGTRSIKMVKGIFKNGKLGIDKTLLLDLPKGLYEDGYIKDKNLLGEIMGSFLRLNDIKRDEVIAVVNSTAILTRDITIPNVEKDEIDGILEYMITDYIPLEPEEYIIQYVNEGTFMEDGNEKLKLFIVAMPKDIAKQHFNLLKDLDLKPRVLDFQSNSMRKFFFLNKAINNNSIIKAKTIASIDIGFYSTKLTIFKGKDIEISRNISLGTKDILQKSHMNSMEREDLSSLSSFKKIDAENLTEEEDLETTESLNNMLDRLLDSLEMIFRYYSSQEQKYEINLIILQGRTININYIKEKFENYFNIKTVSINAFDEILDADLCLYSNAIGGLIRGEII